MKILEDLLEQAREGKITSLVTVAIASNNTALTQFVGKRLSLLGAITLLKHRMAERLLNE